MTSKRFKINTEEDINSNENAYFLNNKNVKSCLIEYYTVIMHIDKEDNTINFDQMLTINTLYYCIYTEFKIIKR